jgi:AraC family transcriptional regulator
MFYLYKAMLIYIKNMVCIRCKMAVQSVLEILKISYDRIELGKVYLSNELNSAQLDKLNTALKHYKLELIEDSRKIIAERIKVVIIEMLHSDEEIFVKFSVHLSNCLQYDYTYLANIFVESERITIEKFYILNKIERVKELILYERMNIKEISYQLSYSSVAHLTQQFKKVTGHTPAEFRKLSESENFVWRTCE